MDQLSKRVERQANPSTQDGGSHHSIRHVRHRVGRLDQGRSRKPVSLRNERVGSDVRVLDTPATPNGVGTTRSPLLQSSRDRTHKCSGNCRCDIDNQDFRSPVRLAKYDNSSQSRQQRSAGIPEPSWRPNLANDGVDHSVWQMVRRTESNNQGRVVRHSLESRS